MESNISVLSLRDELFVSRSTIASLEGKYQAVQEMVKKEKIESQHKQDIIQQHAAHIRALIADKQQVSRGVTA